MFSILHRPPKPEAVFRGPLLARQTVAEPLGTERAQTLKGLVEGTRIKVEVQRDFSSASIPVRTLRGLILTDPDFRSGLRELDASLEELHFSRGGGVMITPFRTLREYVNYVKQNGQESKLRVPLADQFERWKAALEDWGNFKIPALLLIGTASFVIYIGSIAAYHAAKLVQNYANQNSEMIQSPAGLEREVRRRAGLRAEKESTTQPLISKPITSKPVTAAKTK